MSISNQFTNSLTYRIDDAIHLKRAAYGLAFVVGHGRRHPLSDNFCFYFHFSDMSLIRSHSSGFRL